MAVQTAINSASSIVGGSNESWSIILSIISAIAACPVGQKRPLKKKPDVQSNRARNVKTFTIRRISAATAKIFSELAHWDRHTMTWACKL